MAESWSKDELRELRHHLRLHWRAFNPIGAYVPDDEYDAYVDESLSLCVNKKPLNEFIGFVDWVTYKKMGLSRTVDSDEANAAFAKKVLAWYRDCQLLAGPVGDGPEAA